MLRELKPKAFKVIGEVGLVLTEYCRDGVWNTAPGVLGNLFEDGLRMNGSGNEVAVTWR